MADGERLHNQGGPSRQVTTVVTCAKCYSVCIVLVVECVLWEEADEATMTRLLEMTLQLYSKRAPGRCTGSGDFKCEIVTGNVTGSIDEDGEECARGEANDPNFVRGISSRSQVAALAAEQR